MTQSQLVILWVVAGLLASILFFVGLVKPYLVNAQYEEQKKGAWVPLDGVLQKFPDLGKNNPQVLMAVLEPIVKRVDEITKAQKADPSARSNYITGAVFPILILGACAFITAGRQRMPPPPRN